MKSKKGLWLVAGIVVVFVLVALGIGVALSPSVIRGVPLVSWMVSVTLTDPICSFHKTDIALQRSA